MVVITSFLTLPLPPTQKNNLYMKSKEIGRKSSNNFVLLAYYKNHTMKKKRYFLPNIYSLAAILF